MTTKLLEKAIKDAIKKRKPVIGTKQVMHSMKNLDSLSNTNAQAILKEYEAK